MPTFSELEFASDTEKQDAVIRRLEIIGEAVKNLSVEFKDGYSDVPWRKIAGMRDIVIHEYFGVTLARVWRTVTVDLIELKGQISSIRRDLGV